MASKFNAFYAQSGGVTAVINASACGVIQTARQNRDRIGKVYAGRNGIIGALTEDLIDTSKDSAKAIAALRSTPAGAFGSCRFKLKSLEANRREYFAQVARERALARDVEHCEVGDVLRHVPYDRLARHRLGASGEDLGARPVPRRPRKLGDVVTGVDHAELGLVHRVLGHAARSVQRPVDAQGLESHLEDELEDPAGGGRRGRGRGLGARGHEGRRRDRER